MRSIAIAAAVLLAASEGASVEVLRVSGGQLWLKTTDEPAASVLRAISEKTDVSFEVAPELVVEKLTLDLKGFSLERSVKAIVSGLPKASGYSIIYDSVPRIDSMRVRILGVGGPAALVPLSAVPPAVLDRLSMPDPLNSVEATAALLQAGVPQQTMEAVAEIMVGRPLDELPALPVPAAEELPLVARQRLQGLVDSGMSPEQAMQVVLRQEQFREVFNAANAVSSDPNSTLSDAPSGSVVEMDESPADSINAPTRNSVSIEVP